MAKVITVSRHFMSEHPKAGKPTFFAEKIMAALAEYMPGYSIPSDFTDWDWHEYYNARPKLHTIRSGKRWKVGDMMSVRVWSGKPYTSHQIAIAPNFELPRVADIEISKLGQISIDGKDYCHICEAIELAKNDGLTPVDFLTWIGYPFSGQIIFFTTLKMPY